MIGWKSLVNSWINSVFDSASRECTMFGPPHENVLCLDLLIGEYYVWTSSWECIIFKAPRGNVLSLDLFTGMYYL